MSYWFGRTYVEQLSAFCQSSIDGYYRAVARGQDQGHPLYFAEKYHPWHIPRIAWDSYPDAREVFLIRDFRDMVASVFAFNAKRGFDSFGRDQVESDEEYIHRLRVGIEQLLSSWKERAARALLVRYEEVIRRPVQALQAIFAYLELPEPPGGVELLVQRASEGMPELAQHRTSQTSEASIGRWRQDLSPELLASCEKSFGSTLREFGYE